MGHWRHLHYYRLCHCSNNAVFGLYNTHIYWYPVRNDRTLGENDDFLNLSVNVTMNGASLRYETRHLMNAAYYCFVPFCFNIMRPMSM